MRTIDKSSYVTGSLSGRLHTSWVFTPLEYPHCVISHSSQCSTTGVTKDRVCAILSVVLYHMTDAI